MQPARSVVSSSTFARSAPTRVAGTSSNGGSVQERFVDSPVSAVASADTLVNSVMNERGYPMADWEQRAADISVDHADVVDHYRQARATSRAADSGAAGTEELRQAMRHYHALLDDLLDLPRANLTPDDGAIPDGVIRDEVPEGAAR